MTSVALPPELLLQIFEHVEADSDLLQLASSSQLFNHLALEVYFPREGIVIKPPYKSISLFLYSYSGTWAPKALLLHIDLRKMHLRRLIFNFSAFTQFQPLLRDVLLLTKCINIIAQITHLKIHVLALPTLASVTVIDRAYDQLLDTICGRAGICTLEMAISEPLLTSLGDPQSIPEDLILEESPTDTDDLLLPINGTLERLIFRGIPSPSARLCRRAIWMNQLSLTDLKFTNIDLGYDNTTPSLPTVLQDIHLPYLRTLRFSRCRDSNQAPILDFIARHPALTHITYRLDNGIMFAYNPPFAIHINPAHHNLFDNVQHLKVGIQYIHTFLSPTSQMPALKNITLCNSYVNEYTKQAKLLIEALDALQYCPPGVHLTVKSITSRWDLSAWLLNKSNDDPQRPERTLACIRYLTLEQKYTKFLSQIPPHLPSWFALFPALEEIEMWAYSGRRMEDLNEGDDAPWEKEVVQDLVENTKRMCAGVKRLNLFVAIERKLYDVGISTPNNPDN